MYKYELIVFCHIAKTYEATFDHEFVILVPEGESAVYTRFPLMAGPKPIPNKLKRLEIRRMYPKAIADEETIKPYIANHQARTPGTFDI